MLRDAIYFVVLLGWVYLPDPYGLLVAVAAVLVINRVLEKPIAAITMPLEPAQKRIYFVFTLGYFLILLGLLLSWIIRHPSPPGWIFGGLGLVVLLTLLYASYDGIYGPSAKV